jgi:DNA polymerase epsilon subunit 2
MQRAWLREFNALGLQLRPQAAKLATIFLRDEPDPQQSAEIMVEHIKEHFYQQQGAIAAVIDEDVIRAVTSCMTEAAAAKLQVSDVGATQDIAKQAIQHMELGDGIQVYNVLKDVQAFEYRRATRDWKHVPGDRKLFSGADTKAKIYIDRFNLIWQRILLENELIPEAIAADVELLPNQRVLTPVESLIGNRGRKLTFGLLSREHDSSGVRRWTIEDPHRSYPVELEVAELEHLVTDGSFVLAEGELVNDIFRIHKIETAPAVPRAVTNEKDDVPVRAFGGSITDAQLGSLARAEEDNQEGMYVVLSEVHLDSTRTIEKITELLQGYEGSAPPIAYVFMGSFCSSSFVSTKEGVERYRDGFERLKFIMRNLPNHVERGARFIFVPGPNDPGAATLPRAPLTDYMTANLSKEIPGVILATSPCRVRHFSRELVFFRHDVLKLLRRHEVVPLRGPGGGSPTPDYVQKMMAQLLLDQGHLAPLPLEESSILWSFDHTLRLYPLPDAVFIGGGTKEYNLEYMGCNFCSVGPFHQDASFFSYHPIKAEVEPCDVPDVAG